MRENLKHRQTLTISTLMRNLRIWSNMREDNNMNIMISIKLLTQEFESYCKYRNSTLLKTKINDLE